MTCTLPSHRTLESLLLVILPFSYGAATRVPFVFAGLQCRSLSLSMPLMSMLLGCYQLSRVVGNRTVKLLGPRTSLLAGTASGLLGYIVLAMAGLQTAAAAGAHDGNSDGSSAALQLVWLGASLVLVGLSEQITALQIFCKRRYQHDAATVRTRLLQQYASNVCGTSVAFFISGLAYSRGGVSLAAAAGAAFEAVLLLGSAWYLASEEAAVTGAGTGRTCKQAAANSSPAVKSIMPAVTPRSAPGDATPDAKPSSSSRADTPSWISLVVAVTFAVQALLIGTVLSTGPLLVADSMGFGAWHVGLTFAAGEALGSLALIATSTATGQAAIRSILPMPLCLLAVLAAMSCMALLLPLVTSQSNMLALACLALVMGLNDVGTSMSGECQGATLPERHYHSVNVMGNTLRRIGNTVTCVAAPLLYQLHPALPFVLFGSLTLVWTCVLSALFAQRARECTAEDVSCIARRSAWSAANLAAAGITQGLPAASHLAGLEHYMQLSFVSQERRFWAAADGKTMQEQRKTVGSHALPDLSEDEVAHDLDGSVEIHGGSQPNTKLVYRSGKQLMKKDTVTFTVQHS